MKYVLKIGGSILTDKEQENTLSPQFSEVLEKLHGHGDGVLIHGAGSFGHPQAERHGLKTGSRKRALEVHRAVKKLNSKIVRELEKLGLEPVPVHPSSLAYRNPETELHLDKIQKLSKERFLPVLHGDIVAHRHKGFTVLSGDEILAELEKKYRTGRTGFCSSEKGVLNQEAEVITEINSLQDFHDRGMKMKDVTGGMKGKVKELLDKEVSARIFGKRRLENFLEGGEPGTLVRPK